MELYHCTINWLFNVDHYFLMIDSSVCPSWAHLQVLEVQVSLVLVSGLVSTMAVADDWVKEILEQLIGFLITSNTANSHDEGVTWKK